MSPRRSEPSVADGYNEWREKVIGSDRLADPDHRKAGSYGFFEYKAKRLDLTVKAKVYPDFGVTDADGPHLWGVVFPEQARKTSYDERTNTTLETRPHAPEKRFGAKAATRAAAMKAAEACIRAGGHDGMERNDNGTLTALTPAEPATWDDLPD